MTESGTGVPADGPGNIDSVGHVDAVVIGAGHAGLSASYHLRALGVEHVVLERSRIGETWRSQRWDSFTLVTPNWMTALPGFPLDADDPDGFIPLVEVVDYLERYAAFAAAPVRTGVTVLRVSPVARNGGYLVETDQGDLTARAVVVAIGSYQRPKVPAWASLLSDHVAQVPVTEYRSPEALPRGAVLVVGSGQSGTQVAEELRAAGRPTYLAVGRAGRLPRRYRGKDGSWWSDRMGLLSVEVGQLPSRAARFAANPHISGKNGGHTLNLHRFARDGITLTGRALACEGTTIRFAGDMHECLAAADTFAADIKRGADALNESAGIGAPPPDDTNTDDYAGTDGFAQDPPATLDARAAELGAIIWCGGFDFDFTWIDLPVRDEVGYPIHDRGVTPFPGLFFVGLHFQHTRKSDLFYGVGEDAAHVASFVRAVTTGRN